MTGKQSMVLTPTRRDELKEVLFINKVMLSLLKMSGQLVSQNGYDLIRLNETIDRLLKTNTDTD